MSALTENLDAERALLGALLVSNELFDRISGVGLKSSDFYYEIHQDIFEIMQKMIGENKLASPVTIKPFIREEVLKQAGDKYLAELMGNAVLIQSVKDFAEAVRDTSRRRGLISVAQSISDMVIDPTNEVSIDEQIRMAEEKLYQLSSNEQSEIGFATFVSAAKESVESAIAAHQSDGSITGLKTGIIALDNSLSGLNKSDLIVLAGRPSMGKTALATNIGYNVAIQGHKTTMFSFEMSRKQVADRIIAMKAGVEIQKTRSGSHTDEEIKRYVEASVALDNLSFDIDHWNGHSIATIAAACRRQKRKRGLDLVIIDYLQLIKSYETRNRNRSDEVSMITQGLKGIAKELNVPVLALSQLSRQVEARDDKRPQLSDLRESGSIEQDADSVLFVYRDEYYAERDKPTSQARYDEWAERMERAYGLAEVIIGKNRHGPVKSIELSFNAPLAKFGNLA